MTMEIQQPQQDDNIIQTPYHTLIKEEENPRLEQLDVEIKGDEPAPKIYEEQPGFTKYSLYLGEFQAEGSMNHKIYNTLLKANPDDLLEIHISSSGGNFYEILEFYNIIKPKFNNIVTYLTYGYSAGSMAFLMGTERIVYEHSDMMIHSYTGGAYGKRQDMLDQTIHQDKMLNTFFTKIYSQYLTKKEINKLLKGQDFWLDTQDIIKRKICTGIVTDDGVYYTLKEYKKMLKGKK